MKRLISGFLVLVALVSCDLLPIINHDEDQLRHLFLTTGGKDWTCNTNWCGYKPIGEWYGVEAEDGNVVSLDLADNNLTGDLSLYDMAMLKNLDLSGNDFREVNIANLPLNEFKMEYVSCNKLHINYHANTDKVIREVNLRNCKKLGQVIVNDVKELNISGCTISDLDITDWHSGNTTIVLQNVTLTGHLGGITIDYDKLDSAGEFYEKYKDGKYEEDQDKEYYEKSELRIRLEELYSSTGGDRWYKRTNWCSDKPLDQWYGVTLDKDGQLIGLDLSDNNLTGRLNIGDFPFLKELNVSNNNFEAIHISNTKIQELILENCTLGSDDDRNMVSISGVSNVVIKGNSIFSLRIGEYENSSRIESVEISDCVVIDFDAYSECLVGEYRVKNTTLLRRFDPYAESIIIEDSEIFENLTIRSADVQLTNCMVNELRYDIDAKSVVLNTVAFTDYEGNYSMCSGSADGYHGINRLLTQATPVTSYTNDKMNLRYLLINNNPAALSKVWPLSKPITEWTGVTTDARGRVTALDLSSLDMKYLTIWSMGDLKSLVTAGNKFRKIDVENTAMSSLDLSNLVSSETEEIRLRGIKTITVNNVTSIPEIDVYGDSVCVYINNCDFGRGQPISYRSHVQELVIKNSQMERLTGNADNAQVESCIMASCDIQTKYCTIKDSEVYSSMSMDFDNELHIINSSITNPETYWLDGLIYLNNATFTKNGVSKTFTAAAMNRDQFKKLLRDNGLE